MTSNSQWHGRQVAVTPPWGVPEIRTVAPQKHLDLSETRVGHHLHSFSACWTWHICIYIYIHNIHIHIIDMICVALWPWELRTEKQNTQTRRTPLGGHMSRVPGVWRSLNNRRLWALKAAGFMFGKAPQLVGTARGNQSTTRLLAPVRFRVQLVYDYRISLGL